MFLIRLCVGLLVCMFEKPLLLPFQCILCLVAAFQNRSLCTAFILVLLVRDYDSRKIIFIVGGTVNILLKYRNYWYRRYFLEHFHYRSEHRNSFGMLVSLRKQLPPPPGRYNLRSFRVFLCHRRMAGTSYNVCYTKACIQHNTVQEMKL